MYKLTLFNGIRSLYYKLGIYILLVRQLDITEQDVISTCIHQKFHLSERNFMV